MSDVVGKIEFGRSADLSELFGYKNVAKFYVEVWRDPDEDLYLVGGRGGSKIVNDIQEVVKFIKERQ